MTISVKNYIGGEWSNGASTGANYSPADLSELVGNYAVASAEDVEAAIEAASSASAAWAQSGIQQRFDILDKIGTEILARKEELGKILAREEGKSLPESIGETARAGQIFKFFAGEVLRLNGQKVPSVRPGIDVEITREAIGTVGLITPWNFPYAIPAWKIAPALCYGNTVVWKPAEIVSICAGVLAEIIVNAGVPKGVFNLVMGKGSVVGNIITNSKKVKGVSFTGSVGVGTGILQAVTARKAKVQLEMGGKNPLLVLNDANLDIAVAAAINGSYYSTGQRCTASSRLIVEAGIYDAFVEKMRAGLANTRVDNPLLPECQIGPVASQSQYKQDLDYVMIGKQEGAELVFGGEELERATKGLYMSPALFLSNNEARIAREEIFGPVATIIKADNYEHGLALSNDTEFGLCAGIVTQSLKYATHFKRNAEVGMTMVNLPTAGVDYHVPFGGTKGSSYGSREQGSYAAEFYTTVKTSYTQA